MADYEDTVETIAKTMYYDSEYEGMLAVERPVDWDVVGEFTRESYRESARKIVRALGLDIEWGVRTSEAVDTIETPYWNETTARIMCEELLDEEPEREPVLVSRLVGHWLEAEQ